MNEWLPSVKSLVKLAVGLIVLNAIAGLVPTVDRLLYYPVDTVKSFLPKSS